MKKSFIKNMMIAVSFFVSAIAVASVCTSCQGNDLPEEEDISVINIETTPESTENTSPEEETTTLPETETTTIPPQTEQTSKSAVSIKLMTTQTAVNSSATRVISVPTGTQKEVTKPPVTQYDIPPELYMTTRATEETEETETTTTTAPPSAGSYIGDSPNSSFYQERLAVAGDSIAYGFNAYGYIPVSQNIATESVSMWNLDYFTFSTGLGLVDTVAYVNPSILYMSLGMNDVNNSTAEEFAERYKSTIYEIRNRVPDINIVVAGITPVSDDSDFVSNYTIQAFNMALENMVAEINSNHVYYFDAYSVVADPVTNALRPECTGGDGIHLVSSCYYDFLNGLYNMLDETPVKANIENAEAKNIYE
ncbi:MAG: SGNH/GDSL hydrolase family protein [Ruminococcus flavefaciens]|nr:SGNH/GDSL hydrolase family protein [Ruminococcus flavefaciens]